MTPGCSARNASTTGTTRSRPRSAGALRRTGPDKVCTPSRTRLSSSSASASRRRAPSTSVRPSSVRLIARVVRVSSARVVALERGQPLGHGGRRQPELAARRSQSALLHDAQEQREIVEQHYSLLPNDIFEACPIIRNIRKRYSVPTRRLAAAPRPVDHPKETRHGIPHPRPLRPQGSALSFGAGTFGGTGPLFSAWGNPGVDEARRLIDICLEAGVNLFDTADVYSDGESSACSAPRSTDAATGADLDEDGLPTGSGPNDAARRARGWSAPSTTLRRLDTDYIDLLQLHAFDASTPAEEVMSTLDDLVRAGKLRYIGVSNFAGGRS